MVRVILIQPTSSASEEEDIGGSLKVLKRTLAKLKNTQRNLEQQSFLNQQLELQLTTSKTEQDELH